MDKERQLDQKALELQSALAAWAVAENILEPGQKIVFSLRIENTGITVERDTADLPQVPARLRLSSKTKAFYDGEHLRPARLTSEEVSALLEMITSPSTMAAIHELLVQNRNEPTIVAHSTRSNINSGFLRKPFQGKYYRIAKGIGRECQLWEVRPSGK